ncbi:hypothetical protein [Paenibacillus oceani]|uniref:Uncharacterized protein n=1 Tax=Paenibacillus oceani TaxID=2772510 RepID=A0A927C9B2_9BACL|nr:hypothetical protein [Paenibacillus oceani]MBD2862101.1 hypothetical protein [Paenibacillus oceani]
MRRDKKGVIASKAQKLLLAASVLCLTFSPVTASAGKEGVYASSSVYFTLEKVRYSTASDDSILRFAVQLHNGSEGNVDYNWYGVRVTDASGYSYSAQLTGKNNARVQSGKANEFAYEARLPKGLPADELKVTLFSWSYGSAVAMNDLGSLSVSAAMQTDVQDAPAAVVPMAQADSSYASDSKVSFRLGNEYFVYEDDTWNLYADLVAENISSSGFALPAGLKMRLEDPDGQTVAVTVLDGADKPLLPGKPQRLTVRASVPGDARDGMWDLQFYYASGSESVVLDSLAAGRTAKISSIGDSRAVSDSAGSDSVSVQVESAVVSQNDDGKWVTAKVRVANVRNQVVAIPKLTAMFQAGSGGVSVAASDTAVHPAYLSQGETELFSFSALLPKGIDVDDLQLALFETRNGSAAGSSSTGSGTAGNTGAANTGGTNATGGTNNTNTAAGSKTVPILLAGLQKAQIHQQGSGVPYNLGDHVVLALDEKIDVAVMELNTYENENYGFTTAVAKLKVTNRDTTTLALPDLTLDLTDESGRVYSGTRQTNVISQLASGNSYLVTYSFSVPEASEDKPVTLRMYKAKETIPLAAVSLGYGQEDTTDASWKVYPYAIDIKESDLLLNGLLSSTFTYTLKMNAALTRKDTIIADAAISKLQFDVVDPLGFVIGSQTLPFQGTTRMVNQENTLNFSNLKLNSFSHTNYVKVYELIETPNGVVKRFLGVLK